MKWVLLGIALVIPAFSGALIATIFALTLAGVPLGIAAATNGKKSDTKRAIDIRMAFVLGAVCVTTLLGFFGNVSWVFDVLSSFRMQLAAVSLSLAIYFAVSALRIMTVVCVCALAANMWFVTPLFVGTPPAGALSKIKVMLINVNVSTGNPEKVENQVVYEDPDLLVLQEVSDAWMVALKGLEKRYPYHIFKPRDDSFGIAMFSKTPFEAKIVTLAQIDVPTILAKWHSRLGQIDVIATHPLPPTSAKYASARTAALKAIPSVVPKIGSAIVVGDLNTAPFGGKFAELIKSTGLLDSSRGWGFQPTWALPAGLITVPIDHLLHTRDLRVLDRRIGSSVGSDHCPLIVELAPL